MPMTPIIMHPIWQSGPVVLLVGIVTALLLQMLVHRLLPAMLRRDNTELGAAIFAVIGTTYAVLLAFMATTAWDQYSAAEALARHEADLAGSVFEAGAGLPSPVGPAIQADMVAYLTRVVAADWPAQIAGHAIPPADASLDHLRGAVLGFSAAGTAQASTQTFLITASANLAAARRDRRLATHGTIPDLVWTVLLSGGALLVGFSFLLGAPTFALHLLMTAALVGSGLLVVLLIVGLSSPFHGAVTISPDAYQQVLSDIVPSFNRP